MTGVVYRLTQPYVYYPPLSSKDRATASRNVRHRKNAFLAFRITRFEPGTRIRHVTNRWPADLNNRRLKVAHRGRKERGQLSRFASCLRLKARKRTRQGQRPAALATVRRHPRFSGYNRVRADGIREFESGTEAFGFAAPPRLGCREWHMPWSAPGISIRISPPVGLTFYSRVTVHTALKRIHPFHQRTYTVTVRYYVPGWFSLLTTYFRVLKATVKTDILQLRT